MKHPRAGSRTGFGGGNGARRGECAKGRETIEDSMQAIEKTAHTDIDRSWGRVLRDVLVFQFKLVVDGIKDLGLAQVAVGAALVDLVKRDGTPGRRFYGVVRLSDRFDRWLDLHEPMERLPEDTPEFGPRSSRSVDDLIDGLETTARVAVEKSVDVSTRGVEAVRREAERRSWHREPGAGRAGEAFGGA